MKCTEEERENYKKRRKSRLFKNTASKIAKYTFSLLIIITTGLFLRFIYFKTGIEIVKNHAEQAKTIISKIKIDKNNNDIEPAITKPMNQYINNYILKEMKENIEKKEKLQQRQYQIEPPKTKKPTEITAINNRNSDTWEECAPKDRAGLDYSNAVILCRNGTRIILSNNPKF
jgi:hypothetical protein